MNLLEMFKQLSEEEKKDFIRLFLQSFNELTKEEDLTKYIVNITIDGTPMFKKD